MPDKGDAAGSRPIPAEIRDAFVAGAAGHGVSSALHEDDFIFWYIHDQAHMVDKSRAVEEYLQSGRDTALFIKGILDENSLSLILAARPDPQRPVAMLEFASGYGRVTRHAPALLPGIEVTACDIHPKAVDFVRRMGFAASPSSSVPEELALDRAFDVIFAFSFFTHMPRSSWGRWLAALGRQLAPNGLLIFTAHGEVSQKWMGVDALDSEGFFFHAASEQKDLSDAEYGNTVTAFEFVYPRVAASGLKLLQFRQATAGHHDLYVLHNDTRNVRYAPQPPSDASAGSKEQLWAELESVYKSTSWRVTGPLRSVKRRITGG